MRATKARRGRRGGDGAPRREFGAARGAAAKERPDVDVERQVLQERLQVDAHGRNRPLSTQEVRDAGQEPLGRVGDARLELLGAAEGRGEDAALPGGVSAASLRAAEADDGADGAGHLGLHPRVGVLQDEVCNRSVCHHELIGRNRS